MSRTNGQSKGAIEHGPMIPTEEVEISLAGRYQGMTFRIQADYPSRVGNDLRSGDQERLRKALQYIVLQHNGWRDREGMLPSPDTDEFWDRLSETVMVAMLRAIGEEVGKVYSSLGLRRSESASG